jgi:hypothetical protein
LIARSWHAKFTALSLNPCRNESGGKGERPRHDLLWSVISNSWRGNSFSNWTPSLDPTPSFIGIENARSVFEQLQCADAREA